MMAAQRVKKCFFLLLWLSVFLTLIPEFGSALNSPQSFEAYGVLISNNYDVERGEGTPTDADFFYDATSNLQKIIYRYGAGQVLEDIFDYDNVTPAFSASQQLCTFASY